MLTVLCRGHVRERRSTDDDMVMLQHRKQTNPVKGVQGTEGEVLRGTARY